MNQVTSATIITCLICTAGLVFTFVLLNQSVTRNDGNWGLGAFVVFVVTIIATLITHGVTSGTLK